MASSRTALPADAMATVVEAVADVLDRAGIRRDERLLLGFSGGLDSTVLLHALAQLRGRFSFALLAHHVHHGLSPNADEWSRHCESVCQSLGVPFSLSRVVLSAKGEGVEAAARAARHAAWARSDAQWWVSAHHLDDQAETVLFRLLRGTGVEGAAAMAPVTRQADGVGRLRPLLKVSRSVLLNAAQAQGMTWVEDESNADTRYSRNFLRHDVLPVIRSRFAGADEALGRAAANFAEAAQLLEVLAEMDIARCGERPLRRAIWTGFEESRQANMLRCLLRRLDSPMPDRSRLGEAIRQVVHADPDKALDIPLGTARLHVYRGCIWFTPDLPDVPATPQMWSKGQVLAWGEGKVTAHDRLGAGVDASVLERGRVTLRVRWPGCEMRLPGRPGKPFKQLAQEAGVPPVDRARLPILCVDDQPVWIAGIGVAEEAASRPGMAGIVFDWVRPADYCVALD